MGGGKRVGGYSTAFTRTVGALQVFYRSEKHLTPRSDTATIKDSTLGMGREAVVSVALPPSPLNV